MTTVDEFCAANPDWVLSFSTTNQTRFCTILEGEVVGVGTPYHSIKAENKVTGQRFLVNGRSIEKSWARLLKAVGESQMP